MYGNGNHYDNDSGAILLAKHLSWKNERVKVDDLNSWSNPKNLRCDQFIVKKYFLIFFGVVEVSG